MNSLTENREPTSASPYSDEIDLFELIADLWKDKWIIISTTLIASIIAVAYALLATPIYQSQAEVLPPYVSQITALNKGAINLSDKEEDSNALKPISINEAYALFRNTLYSKELNRYFFEHYYLSSLDEKERANSLDSLRASFAKTLSIKQANSKETPDRYQVVVTHQNPEIIELWANEYVALAGKWAKERILTDRKAEVNTILQNTELGITTLKQKLELLQKSELDRLKEGLYIAEKLGIESPMMPEGKATKEGAAYVDQNLLYMRGSKALTAQIEVLEKRGIDVLLLPELRELTVKHEFFKGIKFDEDKISLYNLDAPAELPEKPIKPKKKLVVLIGGLVGFMLGGMIALVRIAMRNRKQTGLN
ncbi:Wzz/FepE/Etk N-terminal domain-containing protein [Ignatzschineria sp. RMDPL8A]|uniref:LPS O-antigen chain length determinant protein WzzB n=1 Tax=Ignatzschineria sp. RMDPL8A TaxID=2999236 RepID=UPI0024467AE3|nr:Wzz/FepE/Etk N-terminal domain-containing protein [Ignatzschineria sp. RMDPL8A]MDG9729823.1 Wzz/FepE/Etk N-terminal domain-containing protein [Ignatzschineria sp. RMDPL8A]